MSQISSFFLLLAIYTGYITVEKMQRHARTHYYYSPVQDSKWKLGQRWALSSNFHWANVGCAMQNHQHFAHLKNVGPTCCTNVGPTCWANVGSLLASGSWANVGLEAAIFIGSTLVGDAKPSALCSSKKCWPNMLYINVGPTCYTNIGPTCCINVGPTCYANVGSLLASGRWANVGLSPANFIGPTLVGDAEPSALCSSENRWPNMMGRHWFSVPK